VSGILSAGGVVCLRLTGNLVVVVVVVIFLLLVFFKCTDAPLSQRVRLINSSQSDVDVEMTIQKAQSTQWPRKLYLFNNHISTCIVCEL